MINRCVLIVRAKEPFLQWVKSLPDPGDITLEEVNRYNAAYLLPEYENDHERDDLTRRFFEVIFAEQLDGWFWGIDKAYGIAYYGPWRFSYEDGRCYEGPGVLVCTGG